MPTDRYGIKSSDHPQEPHVGVVRGWMSLRSDTTSRRSPGRDSTWISPAGTTCSAAIEGSRRNAGAEHTQRTRRSPVKAKTRGHPNLKVNAVQLDELLAGLTAVFGPHLTPQSAAELERLRRKGTT